ncbi:hypothetical protein SVIOM74S_04419 [Streptomyces violarus]
MASPNRDTSRAFAVRRVCGSRARRSGQDVHSRMAMRCCSGWASTLSISRAAAYSSRALLCRVRPKRGRTWCLSSLSSPAFLTVCARQAASISRSRAALTGHHGVPSEPAAPGSSCTHAPSGSRECSTMAISSSRPGRCRAAGKYQPSVGCAGTSGWITAFRKRAPNWAWITLCWKRTRSPPSSTSSIRAPQWAASLRSMPLSPTLRASSRTISGKRERAGSCSSTTSANRTSEVSRASPTHATADM